MSMQPSTALMSVLPAQALLGDFSSMRNGWQVSLNTTWDVLGPFPIHAREQHFLVPSYPLGQLSPPYLHDATRLWPSSLADGGSVGWTTATSSKDGNLKVSFPEIRWKQLRDTEGWSALQHHTILRTTLTVTPPSSASVSVPSFELRLLGGSYVVFIPRAATTRTTFTPEWHNGDIYAMANPPRQLISLPELSLTKPTTYDVFVSGDYEIRLFGDPRDSVDQETPVIDIDFSISVDDSSIHLAHDPSQDVMPDFVDGWAFGHALGLAFRSSSGWWTLQSVEVDVSLATAINLRILASSDSGIGGSRFHIAPHQTRTVALELRQVDKIAASDLPLVFTFTSKFDVGEEALEQAIPIRVVVSLRHTSYWGANSSQDLAALRATYFAGSTPFMFLAKPPYERPGKVASVMVLHGAGVEISEPEMEQAVRRMKSSWIVFPSGRTAWGFDWRGPSVQDVWGSFDSLPKILTLRSDWAEWISTESRVVLMGHSNGAQGTWFHTSRFPDKVIAAVAAAGYVKAQAYVSMGQSHSGHFVDPFLQGILASAMTPDDNDLFTSNLVATPIHAKHGGDDTNVPTWHSRQYVSAIKTWDKDAPISYIEDPGKPHWYPEVLSSPHVLEFLNSVMSSPNVQRKSRFTLTVASPDQSGSLMGWRVRQLEVPGKLARLRVEVSPGGSTAVRTTNVRVFSVDTRERQELHIDDYSVTVDATQAGAWFRRLPDTGGWKVVHPSEISLRPSGPISRVLVSSGDLLLVYSKSSAHALSVASRIAHNLALYLRIQTHIISDIEAVALSHEEAIPKGNWVLLGTGDDNIFTQWMLQRNNPLEIQLHPDGFTLKDRVYRAPSTGLLLLHPHPLSNTSAVLLAGGTDASGLERAFRLFPLRTGVPIADWVVIGTCADAMGAGGILGTGFFDADQHWNAFMSAFG